MSRFRASEPRGWQRREACMVLTAALAFPAAARAAVNEQSFRAGSSMTEDHPAARYLRKFGDLVEEKSNGAMRMTLHVGAALGTDLQMQSQLVSGTQDAMLTATAALGGLVKEMSLPELPYVFKSEEHLNRVFDSPVMKPVDEKLYEKGLKALGYAHFGFRHTTNNRRPITKWEDYNGLKLRVIQNAMYIDMFTALGANPVPMAVSEIFTALETGTIDGQENPVAQIVTLKFTEVQKYLSLTRHTLNSAVLLLSRKTWDRLNPDEQAVVVDAAQGAKLWHRQNFKNLEPQWMEQIKQSGMQINDLSQQELARLAEKLQPIVEKHAGLVDQAIAKPFLAEAAKSAT